MQVTGERAGSEEYAPEVVVEKTDTMLPWCRASSGLIRLGRQ